MDGVFSLSRYEPRDHLCDCGCGVPVAHDGLVPRFARGSCRDRWIKALAVHGQPAPEPAREPVELDDRPQGPPPSADPVRAEEIAEVQAEFARRVTVAPQVETVLTASSGMLVRPRPGALLKFLLRAARKVR